MRRGSWLTRVVILSTFSAALPAGVVHAQLNNDVQWAGISHVGWNDRRPRVPRNGESFQVRFQTIRGDLSAARVRVDDGSPVFIDAAITAQRGPYDLWSATVPATASSTLSYVLELTDGTDTDYFSASGVADELATAIATPFTLNFATLEHAPVGATVVPGGTVFKVWSPTRTTATVRGPFNNWGNGTPPGGNPLTKVGEHFVGFVPGVGSGQMYKFHFNNSVWASDPRSAALVPTNSYNSVVVDQDSYVWQNPGFSARPMDQLVIYQLHVGTFAGRNDPLGGTQNPSRYVDVAARAGHLAELGVNAVLLNPINEFPGDFSGGYQTISPFAIESRLGTPNDFKFMVDSLHARGIAVLLDVVWNHTSASDSILWNFDGTQLYYDNPAVQTPWGAQADLDKAGVREFYVDAAEYLLTEYRLDGFRVDAAMYLTDSGLTPQWAQGQAIVRAVNDLRNRRHADKHAIAEIYIDNPWVTAPTSTGLGFTAQYHNEFKEALRSAVFAAGTGDPNMQRVANVLDGQGFGVSGSSVMNYFELHDDCWNLNGTQRAVRTIDTTLPHDDRFARGRTTVAQALNLLSRGVPAVLQGSEWLEDEGWESNRLDWSHKTAYAGVFQYYRDLIRLRTSEPALFANAPLTVSQVNEAQNFMTFDRVQPGSKGFAAAVNLANVDRPGFRMGLPREGKWRVVINSDATIYAGLGGGPSGEFTTVATAAGIHPRSVVFDLPAHTVVLLEQVLCPGDFNADGVRQPSDIFAFLNAYFAGDPRGDFDGNGVRQPADIFGFLNAYFAAC
jgi:1,4-alpha-glucan branching enzyme